MEQADLLHRTAYKQEKLLHLFIHYRENIELIIHFNSGVNNAGPSQVNFPRHKLLIHDLQKMF